MKITKSELKTIFTGEHFAAAENTGVENVDENEIIAANVEKEIKSSDTEKSE